VTEFDRLQPGPVLETVRRLEGRIAARFPERGLRRLAHELVELTLDVQRDAEDIRGRIRRTRLLSRIGAGLVLAATVVAVALAAHQAIEKGTGSEGLDWLFIVESSINDLAYAAIALYFLYSVPERIQRGRTLKLLHRLRSLAHIVDMHQLTKDPERLKPGFRTTAVSPDPGLDRDQLEHYFDYCSELLSLVSKTAALCAEESRDDVVLQTVSRIEQLTNGMSRKIWQKISVLPSA
jgi:hypothetical protein